MDLANAREFDPAYIAANVSQEAGRFNQVMTRTGVTVSSAFPRLNDSDP